MPWMEQRDTQPAVGRSKVIRTWWPAYWILCEPNLHVKVLAPKVIIILGGPHLEKRTIKVKPSSWIPALGKETSEAALPHLPCDGITRGHRRKTQPSLEKGSVASLILTFPAPGNWGINFFWFTSHNLIYFAIASWTDKNKDTDSVNKSPK